MNAMNKTQVGFTLIEMAMVLVIIGLLLGGLLAPLSTQMEQDKRNKSIDMLEEVKEAILGFAIANGRLPCPANPDDAGVENLPGGGVCPRQHGFVPAVSLGLAGPVNQDGLLQDAWGNPFRYSVTTGNASAFTTVDGIKNAPPPMTNLLPDLTVCTTQACASTLVANAPVVLYSMGNDGAVRPTSTNQAENGETRTGAGDNGPLGIRYWVSNDRVFVIADYRSDAGNEFDDLVTWISPNILYNRMVQGGRLP